MAEQKHAEEPLESSRPWTSPVSCLGTMNVKTQESPDEGRALHQIESTSPAVACVWRRRRSTPLKRLNRQGGGATHQMSPVTKDRGGVGNKANLQKPHRKVATNFSKLMDTALRFMAEEIHAGTPDCKTTRGNLTC